MRVYALVPPSTSKAKSLQGPRQSDFKSGARKNDAIKQARHETIQLDTTNRHFGGARAKRAPSNLACPFVILDGFFVNLIAFTAAMLHPEIVLCLPLPEGGLALAAERGLVCRAAGAKEKGCWHNRHCRHTYH